MKNSQKERLGLGPPDMTVALGQHLSQDDSRKLVECYRLYSKSYALMGVARRVFLVSFSTFFLSYLPKFPTPEVLRHGFGLLALISFLLIWFIRPSLEIAIDQLQELSDKALIRARLRPVDLVTGKPK